MRGQRSASGLHWQIQIEKYRTASDEQKASIGSNRLGTANWEAGWNWTATTRHPPAQKIDHLATEIYRNKTLAQQWILSSNKHIERFNSIYHPPTSIPNNPMAFAMQMMNAFCMMQNMLKCCVSYIICSSIWYWCASVLPYHPSTAMLSSHHSVCAHKKKACCCPNIHIHMNTKCLRGPHTQCKALQFWFIRLSRLFKSKHIITYCLCLANTRRFCACTNK